MDFFVTEILILMVFGFFCHRNFNFNGNPEFRSGRKSKILSLSQNPEFRPRTKIQNLNFIPKIKIHSKIKNLVQKNKNSFQKSKKHQKPNKLKFR